MLRRRMLMQSEKPVSDWDIDWNYTMGFPENNGFDKLVSGSVTVEQRENGIYYKVNSNNNYLRLQPLNFQICNEGVFEVKLSIITMSTGTVVTSNGFRLILSNGENGCQIRVNQGFLKYDNNGNLIAIKGLNTNVDYIIKIKMINNINRIYLDDVLMLETENKSTLFATANRIFFQDYSEYLLKEIRFKKIS